MSVGVTDSHVTTDVLFEEEEANLVRLRVEPGDGALAVAIVAEENVIYALDGSTDRVSRVVMLARKVTPVGVLGIPRKRVHGYNRLPK